MILDGKYILLEKSQYRTILPILYNIGYIWDPNYIVGPINESPFTGDHVKPGATAFTQAPVGAADPVGGNFPNQ